ncbi:glycosyltransferase family 2 protein [Chryseobacterium sp.]|uniref:glycosyltransferase family 2 protein n=1 Tax=Chryseobacterium sp. TaxID=1871047 RepID=UPI001656A7BA|nr:glycosyltransferase family A protein [Chryseobacterium sp.]
MKYHSDALFRTEFLTTKKISRKIIKAVYDDRMTVSVIIPMYNSEQSIIKCLDSVKSQTWAGNFEIIIVNDGSTDQSAEVVLDYMAQNPDLDITLIHQHNQGVSKARNVAMERSKGEFIALLDADDEWLPQKTEKQINTFEKYATEIDFLACLRTGQRILFPYKLAEDKLAKISFRKLMIRNEAQPSTVIIRRRVLENTGLFDPEQRYAEDLNYWLRISQKNKMYILAENLVFAGNGKRTFGVSGLSANLTEMEKGFQKNLSEMYRAGRIGSSELIIYSTFYSLKYVFRLFRNLFYTLKGK